MEDSIGPERRGRQLTYVDVYGRKAACDRRDATADIATTYEDVRRRRAGREREQGLDTWEADANVGYQLSMESDCFG